MNWYKKSIRKEASLKKNASLTMYIADASNDQYEKFKDVLSMCFAAKDYFYNKALDKETVAKITEEVYPQVSFEPDGNDFDKSTGIINIYCSRFPEEIIKPAINKIIGFFNENGITTGKPMNDISNMTGQKVIKLPIIENEVVKNNKDVAPELNMSNGNAHFIMQKVLGYNKDLWTDGDLKASELKSRIEYYLGETKLPSAEKGSQQALSLEDLANPENEGLLSGRSALTSYDEETVRSRLNELLNLCNWALNRGYNDLYMA